MPAKGTYRHRKVRGELYPGGLLTVDAVMRSIGIGREQLGEARRAGVVKAYMCGGTAYYRSEEIIAWILQGGSRKDSANEAPEAQDNQANLPEMREAIQLNRPRKQDLPEVRKT